MHSVVHELDHSQLTERKGSYEIIKIKQGRRKKREHEYSHPSKPL